MLLSFQIKSFNLLCFVGRIAGKTNRSARSRKANSITQEDMFELIIKSQVKINASRNDFQYHQRAKSSACLKSAVLLFGNHLSQCEQRIIKQQKSRRIDLLPIIEFHVSSEGSSSGISNSLPKLVFYSLHRTNSISSAR